MKQKSVLMYIYNCEACNQESKCGCYLPTNETGHVVKEGWKCPKCGAPVENLVYKNIGLFVIPTGM